MSVVPQVFREHCWERGQYYEHEMRALIELGETGLRWRYLGHVPARYAASVVLTKVP